MSAHDCPRVNNKWFRGCQFEARYDLSPADLRQFGSFKGELDVSQFRQKTYVRDICVHCGRTVERISQTGETLP